MISIILRVLVTVISQRKALYKVAQGQVKTKGLDGVAQWRETVHAGMLTARQAGNKCMSSWVQVACKHKLRYKIKQR